MKMPRRLSLRALWQKLRRRKTTVPERKRPPLKETRTIEPLEGRIAPASLIDGSTLIYKDLEGDTVTVKFSQPIFDPASPVLNALLEGVFTFSAGDAHSGTDTPQQLQLIDLSKAPVIDFKNRAAGTSLSVIAEKTGGSGDDLADIGAIKASGLALGKITIDGDLGQIDCGNSTSKIGLKSLNVQTLGAKGLSAQTAVTGTGTAGDAEKAEKLESKITGGLGVLSIQGDDQGYVHVLDGTQISGNQTIVTAPGKIGEVTIAGALRGLAAVGVDSNNTGLIDAAGSIGKVRIGTDIAGGGGTNSGALLSSNQIKSVTVTGFVNGGAGAGSGRISAGGKLGAVGIGNSLVGGDGANSGVVHSGDALGTVKIAHDLTAGLGSGSGLVSSDATIGTVTVTGNILGDRPNAGSRSGGISAVGTIHGVVAGALSGGPGTLTGFIESQHSIDAVEIRGNVVGGAGLSSGSISAGGTLSSVTLLGTLQGGAGVNSGSIFSGTDANLAGDLKSVRIDGAIVSVQGQATGMAVVGGDGDGSGLIRSGGSLGKIVVGSWSADFPGAALQGGEGDFSGAIYSEDGISSVRLVRAAGGAGDYSGSTTAHGLLKTFSGDLGGGTGLSSGSVRALDSLTADRDIAGQLGNFSGNGAGGAGTLSGAVWSDGSVGKITGVFTAAAGERSGSITTGAGVVGKGDVDRLEVSLIGTATNPLSVQVNGAVGNFTISAIAHATIRVADAIRALDVQGDLNDVLLTARGQSVQGRQSDLAIARIHIAGSVNGSQILAGYDLEGQPVNPDAQIGPVTVGGSWTASDLVAGVRDVAGDGFGNDDDVAIGAGNPGIISRLASVVIQGAITGTENGNDHFGFVAEQIAFFKFNGSVVALNPVTLDVQSLDVTNNHVFLREVQTV